MSAVEVEPLDTAMAVAGKAVAAQQAVDEIVSEITGEPTPTVEELQARVAELETQLVTAGRTMIEFRAQVRHEAMAMAQQHNLCSVVENTLRKVGIDVERTVVEVVSTTENVRTFDVPNDLLASISEAQFLSWVTTGTQPRGLLARDMRAIQQRPVRQRTVGDPVYRVVPRNERPRDPETPPGFLAAYGSDDARVRHLVHVGTREVDVHHNGRYVDVHGVALCGASGAWMNRSSRGENRTCLRCGRQAAYMR